MANGKSAIRILVVGAGPAGLLVGQALKKQGYNCTLFEQDAAIGARPRDWNFGIYWAQKMLQDCLPDKLIDRIVNEAQVDSRGCSPDTVMPWYNSSTGEHLKSIPIPNQIRIHRKNFLKLISKGLNIEFGKRVKKIHSDGKVVTVSFDDGTQAEGDLLIGAEGAHSQVREYLVGKEKAAPKKAPLAASYTIAKLPAEAALLAQAAHPRMYAHTNSEGNLWISSVHDAWEGKQPGEWQSMILVSRPVDRDTYDPSKLQGPLILEDMKRVAKEYTPQFKTIIESIPEGTKCWHNQLSYWIPEPWDNRNGTVTLIGDAAHPMTYHRGQGLNNAVLDVASLTRQIADLGALRVEGRPSGIDKYEQEMWERGSEAVKVSLENSIALHDWDGMTKSHLFVSGALQKTDIKAQA